MTDDLTTRLPETPDLTGRAVTASASGTIPTIHHFNIKTNRLDDLIDFYGKVAGMVPNFRWEGGAFLSNDAANHRLAILSGPQFIDDPERPSHVGLHHSAFEFSTVSQLLDHFAALREIGIVPSFSLNHGLTTSFYYKDPDSNFVELQADNFGDWEKSTEFIRTSPQFAKDPIGPLVDPGALYDAKRSGMSDVELHRRSYAGEFPPSEEPDFGLPPEAVAPPAAATSEL
ncbi:MAG TPA: VOC family protein [Solirubrobacteraceae bacterium]|nr:VOC family protein [Solirubrobacteraceae bacterium]